MLRLKGILSLLLLSYLLIGTTGVSVYKSYCTSKGISTTFLTQGNDICDEVAQGKSCCEKSEDDGCGKKSHSCCAEEEVTLLLELPFSEQIQCCSILPIVVALLPDTFGNSVSIFMVQKFDPTSLFSDPPKLFGKSLLQQIAVWRI